MRLGWRKTMSRRQSKASPNFLTKYMYLLSETMCHQNVPRDDPLESLWLLTAYSELTPRRSRVRDAASALRDMRRPSMFGREGRDVEC